MAAASTLTPPELELDQTMASARLYYFGCHDEPRDPDYIDDELTYLSPRGPSIIEPVSPPSNSPAAPPNTTTAELKLNPGSASRVMRNRTTNKLDADSKCPLQDTRTQSDEAGPSRAVYLEKNRQAAKKCRSKQKKQQNDLVEKAQTMERKNKLLRSEVEFLKNDMHDLMEVVIQHSSCPDQRLANYMQREAAKIAKSGCSRETKTKDSKTSEQVRIRGMQSIPHGSLATYCG